MTENRQRYFIRRISAAPKVSGAKRLYLRLTLITAAGAVLGAYSCIDTGRYPAAAEPKGFYAGLLSGLSVMMIYTAVCFFSGLSAVGAPVGYALCFFKGMGTGAVTAGGVSWMLPFEAIGTAAVIFAARETVSLSGLIYGASFGRGSGCSKDCIKLYLLKFAVISAAAASAALINSLMSELSGSDIGQLFVRS